MNENENKLVAVEAKRVQLNDITHFLQEKLIPTILKDYPEVEPMVAALVGEIALIISKAEDVCNSDKSYLEKAGAVAGAVASLVNLVEHLAGFTKLSSAAKRGIASAAVVCLYDRIDKGHDDQKDRFKIPGFSAERSDTIERGAVGYGVEIAVAVFNLFWK